MQLLQVNKLRLAALLGLCRVCLVSAEDLPTRIKIDSGEVVGAAAQVPEASATVNRFLGIPFAASPPERFSSPKSPAPWQEPLQATAFKPACVQQFTDSEYSSSEKRLLLEAHLYLLNKTQEFLRESLTTRVLRKVRTVCI